MSRPSNVVHFAIECDDVERARRFYENVFGWRIVPWGPPDYYQVISGTADEAGILGDLRTRREPLSGTGNRGFEATLRVDSLADIMAAIEAHGGRIVARPYRIEGVGDIAYFADSEGNRAGVMQHDPAIRLPEGVRI